MSAITGDRKYVDAMDREWSLTQQHLYDPQQRLFYRDATYLGKKEANGQPIFLSRGNGWVLAGTADVLQAMPKNDPLRPKYERLFRDMATRVAGLQQPDGLWRPGLLDPQHYALPEISGSAFFTYAIAWGVNNGLLSRQKFGPVIERAWAGMLQHVYADGRLGCIQPIGAAPGAFTESSSYVYGVGAFLMTGAEMMRYAK
jgi:rhamnogalacturonyl hydrolase YesR